MHNIQRNMQPLKLCYLKNVSFIILNIKKNHKSYVWKPQSTHSREECQIICCGVNSHMYYLSQVRNGCLRWVSSPVPFISVLSLPLHNFLFASVDTSWHPCVMLLGDPGGCVRVCAQHAMVNSVFSSPHSFIICAHWELFPSQSESCFRL